jgi:hypothetical protein
VYENVTSKSEQPVFSRDLFKECFSKANFSVSQRTFLNSKADQKKIGFAVFIKCAENQQLRIFVGFYRRSRGERGAL